MTPETEKRQRRCVVCGKQATKASLTRIVRSSDGVVVFDATGRAPGRGAYVCSEACFTTACKTRKLERALKTKLDQNEYERIAAEVSSAQREA